MGWLRQRLTRATVGTWSSAPQAAGSRVATGPTCVPKGPLLSPDAVTCQSLPRPPSSRRPVSARPGGPAPLPPPATMSTSSLRRQMKNIVHNYSEAEIKVREATSNDPWGPSSSLMSEIADLTYNVVAFSEIMSMIWKRLNDHGKNWRHVYKVSAGRSRMGRAHQGVPGLRPPAQFQEELESCVFT